MALLSSNASASKASMVKNKGLITEAYKWDEEEVSSDHNEMVKVKTLMALAEENDDVSKESARNGQKDLVFVKSSADDIKVSIPGVERPWLLEAKGFILTNHDTSRIRPAESQRNTTDPSVAVTNSSATDYDSADEYLICSTLLPPLKKLDGAEPISGPKTIKFILRSKSIFKAEKLKGSTKCTSKQIENTIQKSCDLCSLNNHLSENHYKVLFCKKCERTDHRTCDHDEYISTKNMSQHLKSLGRSSSKPKNPRPSKHFFPPCIHYGFSDHLSDDCVNYPICDTCGSYDHDTHGHNMIISLRRGVKPRNPQHVMKSCETCGSAIHTTTDHNDIEWFKRGKELQAKKAEALKSSNVTSGNPSGTWTVDAQGI
ncbi:hypothetical protein Tco_1156183 [Tanacetum coccineum]